MTWVIVSWKRSGLTWLITLGRSCFNVTGLIKYSCSWKLHKQMVFFCVCFCCCCWKEPQISECAKVALDWTHFRWTLGMGVGGGWRIYTAVGGDTICQLIPTMEGVGKWQQSADGVKNGGRAGMGVSWQPALVTSLFNLIKPGHWQDYWTKPFHSFLMFHCTLHAPPVFALISWGDGSGLLEGSFVEKWQFITIVPILICSCFETASFWWYWFNN